MLARNPPAGGDKASWKSLFHKGFHVSRSFLVLHLLSFSVLTLCFDGAGFPFRLDSRDRAGIAAPAFWASDLHVWCNSFSFVWPSVFVLKVLWFSRTWSIAGYLVDGPAEADGLRCFGSFWDSVDCGLCRSS
ncbi:unnamed protein product [Ophioblennius macclurei]